MGSPLLMGSRRKARALTVPSVRASAGASANNGTDSVSITVPQAAQVGDLAIFHVSCKVQAAPTVSPSGAATWEHTSQIADSANQPFIHTYTRRIQAGDISIGSGEPGLTVTFAFSAGTTDGICGGVIVWQDTSGFSIRPTSDFQSQTDTLAAHQHGPVALYGMGDYDAYGGVAAVQAYTATGIANVTLTAPPSGCTIASGTNVQALRAAGASGTCRGQAMFTGPTHAARVETLTYPVGQEWTTTVAYAMAPISPRKVQTQQGPPSLDGLEVYNYSNSSGSCVVYNQADATRGCNTYRPWPERVARAFGPVNPHLADGTPRVNNMAMGGARAADICTAAYGTYSYTSVRAGSQNSPGQTNQFNPQTLTQSALTGRLTALYTLDLIGNDFLKLGTDDLTMAGGWNAMDALIRLIRSSSQIGAADPSHTYAGTWTDVTSDGYMGGAAKKTTVAGSKVTIAVTDVNKVNLVLIAYDDAAIGAPGSAFTVKVDGVTRTTQQTITLQNASGRGGSGSTFTVKGTTSNQHQSTGVYRNYKFCQMTIEVDNIGAGAHTIEVAPTITGGSEFVYNGYLIPAVTPPWIVSAMMWRLPNATYTAAPLSFATAALGKQTADWFNQMVQQVADQFTDKRVIVYDPSGWGAWDSTPTTGDGSLPAGFQGWDAAVMVSDGDGLHQSDIGCAFNAKRVLQLLNERLPSPTTPFTLPTSLMPSTIPATITLLGTRDFTVTAGNNTFAIECEAPGGGGGGGATGLQGRGGGGGAYAKKNTTTYTVGSVLRGTVGIGGPGGGPNTAGAAGSFTQVVYLSGPDFPANTVLCRADFGTGGDFGKAVPGPVGTGGQAANCVGDVKTSGTSGSGINGGAAAAPLGGAGGVWSTGNGTAGTSPGGGGSGGGAGSTTGGSGAPGLIKFT